MLGEWLITAEGAFPHDCSCPDCAPKKSDKALTEREIEVLDNLAYEIFGKGVSLTMTQAYESAEAAMKARRRAISGEVS